MRSFTHKFIGPGRCLGLLCLALVSWLGAAGMVPAQQAEPAPATQAVPVLTLDWEQLFDATQWGNRIKSELTEASRALNAENNRVADDLVAEEKALTERRATMAAADFRAEADAFDERATAIRKAQQAKAQALTQSFEAARGEFFNAVAPLLDEILTRRGAVVVLDRRVIIRGLAQADITAELAERADAELGTGPETGGLSVVPDAPAQN